MLQVRLFIVQDTLFEAGELQTYCHFQKKISFLSFGLPDWTGKSTAA